MSVTQNQLARSSAELTVDTTMLDVSGILDGARIDMLLSSVTASVEKGTPRLILNLTNVESISGAGVVGLYMVAELLDGRSLRHLSGWSVINEMELALKHGTQFNNLSLVAPNPRVVQTLREHGLNRLIRTQPTLGDAVLALAA